MVRWDWLVDVGNIPVIPTLRRVRLEEFESSMSYTCSCLKVKLNKTKEAKLWLRLSKRQFFKVMA